MIKVSDYIFQTLVKKGVTDVFMVSGGGIMHLCDSLRKEVSINVHSNYHEQACAIAAEGYSRMSNKTGVCLVTTGPGSANALSGVVGAWVDSVPLLIISGQVRTGIMADFKKERQLGPQEINIDEMATSATKYFKTIIDPNTIQKEIEFAWEIAREGRPGPVWLNIPLDIQGQDFNEKNNFIPENSEKLDIEYLNSKSIELLEIIKQSQRPVIVAGNGVRLSGALENFISFYKKVQIPVLTSIGSLDYVDEDDEFNIGRYGALGQRRANYILQNSDLVIAVGASLSIASIGFNFEKFAPQAKKVMINIDRNEIYKKTLKIDLPIIADVNSFLDFFLCLIKNEKIIPNNKWKEVQLYFKNKYPILETRLQLFENCVNSYEFVNELSEQLEASDIITTGNALDIWSIFHSFKTKFGQRIFTNINHGSMGWDIPGSIGACIGSGKRRTILVTGDGSFQFNIQELQTIRYEKLPIYIFIFDNDGYQSIRSTQDAYFSGQYIGSNPQTGILNPHFEFLAKAYDFEYFEITNSINLKENIEKCLKSKGPIICRVKISPLQERRPKVISRTNKEGITEASLEDMFPFISEDEKNENLEFLKLKINNL